MTERDPKNDLPKSPKKAKIFLNGTYPPEHLGFYRDAVKSTTADCLTIAVDGALRFFADAGLTPQLILGDFDSVSAETLEKFKGVETVRFNSVKDLTDGELAVRRALSAGCCDIEIYGAVDTRFETDQMLANIFLLRLIYAEAAELGTPISARLIDHRQLIFYISNEAVELAGHAGEMFSVIPISETATLTVRGAKWELDCYEASSGSSHPLRNEFAGNRVQISIAGQAILVHRHTQ